MLTPVGSGDCDLELEVWDCAALQVQIHRDSNGLQRQQRRSPTAQVAKSIQVQVQVLYRVGPCLSRSLINLNVPPSPSLGWLVALQLGSHMSFKHRSSRVSRFSRSAHRRPHNTAQTRPSAPQRSPTDRRLAPPFTFASRLHLLVSGPIDTHRSGPRMGF